ncbi:MAG: hypothetical protein AB7E95_08915 [Kiritimatiellales bacterium]
MSVWAMIAEPSSNSAHTNASVLALTLNTSATVDGTYTFAKAVYGNVPTAVGEWQQLKAVYTAADLQAYAGEYIQVRYVKSKEDTVYRIYLDNACFSPIEQKSLSLIGVTN